MNRLDRERTPWADAVTPAARLYGTDSVADLLKDCARMGLLDELRSTLGMEAKPDQRAVLRAVRDLVYELAGAKNRDLAVDVLIHATGIAEFDRLTLRDYARKHGLSHEGFRKQVLAMRQRLNLPRRQVHGVRCKLRCSGLWPNCPVPGLSAPAGSVWSWRHSIEPDAWRRLVAHLARLAHTTTGARQTITAWLGDALAYGEASYRGRIATCAGEAGLEPGTLRNAKMVCSRIPVSCRHDGLSWTHHCEVALAFANPTEIEQWLALAEKEKLSTGDLRKRIRAHIAGGRQDQGAAVSPRSMEAFELLRELPGRMPARSINVATYGGDGRPTPPAWHCRK